jgi:amino acid transporter
MQGIFVREATGLVKDFGAKEAFLIATALIWALLYTVLQFPWYFGFQQGADLTVALVIATVPWIVFLIPYWAIGIIMPRSGNDYVWIGRVLSPVLGFTWSLVYTFAFYSTAMANFVAFVAIAAGSLTFQGTVQNNAALTNLGAAMSSPIGTFEVTLLLIAGFAAFAFVGTKSIKRFLYVTWGVTAIGFLLTVGLFATATPAIFQPKWDSVLSQYVTYHGVIDTATKGGWSVPTISIAASVASLPFASLFLFGGQNMNIVAGEVKNVRRSIPLALIASLLVSVAIWIAVVSATLNAVGYKWMSAIGYLYDGLGANGASLANLPFAPSITMMMSVLAYPNQFLLVLIPLTFFIGSLGGQFFYWWIPSRYFFAWSFDRLIPAKFADVNTKFASPHYAILLLIVFSVFIAAITELTSYSSLFSLGTFLWGGAYIIPMLAAAAFPFIKKDLVNALPGFLKYKIAGVTTLTIISIVGVLLSLWEDYLFVSNPYLLAISTNAILTVVAIIVFGFAVYYASVAYHKRQGLDIRRAFKEIPPE